MVAEIPVVAIASAVPAADADGTTAGVATESEPGSSDGAAVTCAKCKVPGPLTNMIVRSSFKADLRYNCKGCNAVMVQCQRQGLQLQNLLSGERLTNFFAEAAVERQNCEDGRMTFRKSRGLLKRLMLEEARHQHTDSQCGEYQPLSYWELKGYDTSAIESACPMEEHPVLGATYKLDIHKVRDDTILAQIEQQISQLENEALQKKQAASSAGKPLLDLECALEDLPENKKRKRGGLTEEEKEARKAQKKREREAEHDRKNATAAAAKVLPQLQAVQRKLDEKIGSLPQDARSNLPPATHEEIESTQKDLKDTVLAATKLLDHAAKGTPLKDTQIFWRKEKELQGKVKNANSCLRNVCDYKKSLDKENALPKQRKAQANGRK